MKRAAQKLERVKRKLDKCSKCGALGHKKNMRACPQYVQLEEQSDSDSDDDNDIDDVAVFSDEASHNLDTSTAESTASEFTDAENTEEEDIGSDTGEEIDDRRGNDNRDSLDDSIDCTTS